MIGIFGDSFADLNPIFMQDEDNDVLPWAMHFEKMVDKKVIVHAQSATSTFWSYKNFINYFDAYDTIIFAYSEYDRWSCFKDEYRGLAYLKEADRLELLDTRFKEYGEALLKIKPLIDDDFDLFVYQSIFDKVNEMCKEANKPIINLMPFELNYERTHTLIDLGKAHGPCLVGLFEISLDEVARSSFLDKVFQTNIDLRHNHLNSNNNKVLAQIINESFSKDNGIVNLAKDPRFLYDDLYVQHIKRYIEKQ